MDDPVLGEENSAITEGESSHDFVGELEPDLRPSVA